MNVHLCDIWLSPQPFSRRVAVQIILLSGKPRKETWVGYQKDDGDISFEFVPEGEFLGETTSITEENAQRIFDSLWRAGYRPHNGNDSEGVYAAQKQHIEDLRSLVKLLGEQL